MATPGVTTLIRDRFYSISRQDIPSGPRVVVIAKRNTPDETGSVSNLDVVQATTEADVITAFGSKSDLHKAFLELVAAGAERIHMVPLPSDTIWDHTTGAVTSVQYGGSVFDAAFSAAEAALPDIIIPWGRGGNELDWDGTFGATPNSDEYGFHADNSSVVANSWAYKVGLKVKEISENTNACLAVMGVKPYSAGAKESLTPAVSAVHVGASGMLLGLADRTDALMKVVGSYLAIVAAEVKPVGYSVTEISGVTSFGYSNGAAALAAALSRTPSYTGISNKALYNVQALRYAPTRAQQNTMNLAGLNTIILNYNKVAVFGGAVTYAPDNSDYIRLSTKRIVDEASSLIRQVCQKFIGEPSTIQIRNSMDTAISSALRGMQIKGALLESDFNVTYVPSQSLAIIDLVLTPAFELNSIQVQLAINI